MTISKEDLDKAIEKDFEKINPSLSQSTIEGREDAVKNQIKNFYYAINNYFLIPYGGNFNQETLFLYGSLFRCHELYMGFFNAWGNKNIHINAYSLRAIAETLALVNYCNITDGYLNAALLGSRDAESDELKIRNIMTMLKHLEKKYEGITQDYDSLSDYVHPNPTSLFASFHPKGDGEKGKSGYAFSMRFGGPSEKFDQDMINTSLNLLLHWTDWFFKEIETLFETQHAKLTKNRP